MGQLLEMPPADQRTDSQKVEDLARIGAGEEDIAADLQISLEHLREHFRKELETGNARGKHQILQTAFEKAASGDNMQATALWLKARCGWRDTGASPQSTTIHHAIVEIITKSDENAPVQNHI